MAWQEFAKQLGQQLVTQGAGGVVNNLTNRMFGKHDRKVNWDESERYGERYMGWEKQMADYNMNMSKELAAYNQQLSKDYFDYTSPDKQMAKLKAAGLNPGLIYSTGGNSGQTGGAQAAPVKAEAPNEQYHQINYPTSANMSLRETPAERELKLAQAENLRSQTEKTKGVDTSLAVKQIENLDAGIDNEKAKNALIKAQTLSQELSNKLSEGTMDDQKAIVHWTSKSAFKHYEMAENEVYISDATKETKVKLLNQELVNSIIEAKLKEATIKHLGKQNDKIDQEIRKISLESADIVIRRSFDQAKLELDKKRVSIESLRYILEEQAQGYKTLHQVGGKIVDTSINSIYTLINSIATPLGAEPGRWK